MSDLCRDIAPAPEIAQDIEIVRGGRMFRLAADAPGLAQRAAFTGGAEAATLAFFDAVLPHVHRVIDVGAYVGAMSLYAATAIAEVHAVEASPTHVDLLRGNLARNATLAGRIEVHACALGAEDGEATLYAKSFADSGSSLFETVERDGLVRGRPTARVAVRAAVDFLTERGLDAATLLKIDIEGAEYEVLPQLRPLLERHRPFLQISFHPFNLVADDPYTTTLGRLRAGVAMAELLAFYPYVCLPGNAEDNRIALRWLGPAERPALLQYILTQKRVERVASPQFGFVDAVGFAPALP